MIHPSLLVPSHPGGQADWSPTVRVIRTRERRRVAACDLRWVRPCRCGRHSHPPNPRRAETRPLPRRRWRDALFEGPFQSSFQACLYVLSYGWARWLPTARLDEHRLSKNTIDLVCAFGEQRKLPSLPIHYFAEPSSERAVRFHSSLSRGHPAPFV
jgi:hypothetical protein